MSETSWKKEFYPTPASKIKTALGAARHSLRKWRGALKKNLKKHEMKCAPITFDIATCALCCLYLGEAGNCVVCPLHQIRGNVDCCKSTSDEKINPYDLYDITADPRPMILWLEKLVKKLEKRMPHSYGWH